VLCRTATGCSAYEAEFGFKVWVTTEHDRSVTTVLLPEDY